MRHEFATKRQLKTAASLFRAIEPLELRCMLSGSAILDPDTQILTINGTADDNQIILSDSGGAVHVTVDGEDLSAGGFADTDVAGVVVNALDGNDLVDLGNITANATVFGGPGNDTIYSGGGDDRLVGGDGDDTYAFRDRWGSDIIEEAANGGNDTMDFSACASGLLVTVGVLQVTDQFGDVANHGGNEVENVIGGSGNDVFHFLNGLASTGTLDGGGGNNSLDYSAYISGINVDLATGSASNTGGIQHMSDVFGGAGADSITGDASANILDGGPGENAINGGGGADTFAFSSTGHDAITEPAGSSPVLDFSAFTAPLKFTIAKTGVTVSAGSHVLANGVRGASRLIGGHDNDSFVFQKGARFAGTVDGGLGINTLDYRAYTTPVNVSLPAGTATGTGGIARFSNIYGGSASDTLRGDDNANRIFGMAGNDKIYGNGGNDYLSGGDGNDVILGGAGNDKIYGGAGNDTLNGGPGSDYLSGDAGNDIIYARDNVRDTVIGRAGADRAKIDKNRDKVSGVETLLK